MCRFLAVHLLPLLHHYGGMRVSCAREHTLADKKTPLQKEPVPAFLFSQVPGDAARDRGGCALEN